MVCLPSTKHYFVFVQFQVVVDGLPSSKKQTPPAEFAAAAGEDAVGANVAISDNAQKKEPSGTDL